MAGHRTIRTNASLPQKTWIVWLSAGVVCCVFGGATGTTDMHKRRGFTDEAIARLSEVFELPKVPVSSHHRSPPEIMLDLYNKVAYSDGITKGANPFDADVVRGFADKATTQQMHFLFNVSHLTEASERVLQAELHLFKLHPRLGQSQQPTLTPEPEALQQQQHHLHRQRRSPHLLQIRLYQVLDLEEITSLQGLRLLSQRRISAHDRGWEVFPVKDTVTEWANGTSPNHGFLVTLTSADGYHINNTITFAQKHTHHDSKQPVLVVFTEEQRRLLHQDSFTSTKKNKEIRDYVKKMNEGYWAQLEDQEQDGRFMSAAEHRSLLAESRSDRVRRETNSYYKYGRKRRKACARHELYVDFGEIGWSGWIISPKGYNAYHCKGQCPFPLGQNQKPTNHATVQSIVHAMRIVKGVETPSCVPNKLYSISLLYFDDEENVILKQYDDMVAASCGCH